MTAVGVDITLRCRFVEAACIGCVEKGLQLGLYMELTPFRRGRF